jgi:hypothetical protein
MNKKLVLWFVLIISIAVLSCGRNNEFGKELVLSKDDPSHVYLYRKGQFRNTIVVDQQVVDVLEQNGVVLVLRKVAESLDCEEKEGKSIITHYSSKSEYWVLETSGNRVFGPLGKSGFDELLQKRGVVLKRPLQEGTYKPNTAEFERLKSTCKQ